MMKRWMAVMSLAFFAAMLFVTTAPGPATAANVSKFGVSTPLSGPAAPWGIPHLNATKLVFDEVNAQGGIDVGG